MGHKKVCLDCRKAFSIDINAAASLICPDCGKESLLIAHRFRPPAKDDLKKWKVVAFLIENGFPYHHVYEKFSGKAYEGLVAYPETMEEARKFVEIYAGQKWVR